MDLKKLANFTKIIVRFAFVAVNNFYCIPVHLVWLLFLCPLQWISENLYWAIEGILFRWLLSMVAVWCHSAGYHITELGDDISDIINERSVFLFNHQSTSDVPLIMTAFNSRGVIENVLWIMNSVFKRTNFGVVSMAHGDFFITAGKEHRESSLNELVSHLRHFYIPRDRKWIMLFPEGGFLKNRKESSQRFATKNNLPHLENVSLPRVGALKVILDTLVNSVQADSRDRIKYIVDVTLAYPKGDPLDLQTIMGGWRPSCDTIFHYKRYKIEELPSEEDALMKWLYERYYEKEKILQDYYDCGKFPDVYTDHRDYGKFPDVHTDHRTGGGLSEEAQRNNVDDVPRRLKGHRVLHDPLQFIVRHLFYIASTWLWLGIIQRLLGAILS